ncbi:hypothetical protein GCM10010421_48050 [Streptomyces glaucus]|uniref:Uncharacterized protein n=1 Tax=Streptomyces glaucus TaxID=284029 RepID=A0ABN3K651_9ACTN
MVDVVADLPADAQAPEPVWQRDGALHDPAVDSETGAVFGAASGDDRGDPEPADLVAVDAVVIAAVGADPAGAAQGPAAPAADRRNGLDQRDQLGDVVAASTGQGHRQRDAVRPDNHGVLAAGLAPVHRGTPGGWSTLQRAHVRRVDGGPGEFQHPGRWWAGGRCDGDALCFEQASDLQQGAVHGGATAVGAARTGGDGDLRIRPGALAAPLGPAFNGGRAYSGERGPSGFVAA